MYRVCFVCTGNICRSPMAESVFRSHVTEAGLDGRVEVDSTGTGGRHEGDGKVRLLRSYDAAAAGEHVTDTLNTTDTLDVPDPYYGSLDGFEECLELVEAASPGLLDAVRAAVKEHTP
ncbi:low molecular weight phosphotyrosine protein phosphatase [Streptomyces sp. NPDC006512]|uniref:arsenate reductase/protein-tyrosine-phosphatase family protein n=1 Tax=Streptomyces sp. NPDC006512 TaxID=3154307 RepID=UPI0033B6ADBB